MEYMRKKSDSHNLKIKIVIFKDFFKNILKKTNNKDHI